MRIDLYKVSAAFIGQIRCYGSAHSKNQRVERRIVISTVEGNVEIMLHAATSDRIRLEEDAVL